MNCYDFDKTIYKGDSTTRFVLFLFNRHPKTICLLPGIALAGIQLLFGKRTLTEFKQSLFKVFRLIPDIYGEVDAFWKINGNRIKKWYLKEHREDDVVISGSPKFLIAPICKRIGISRVIGTIADPKNGELIGENCGGEEKVRRFYEKFPNAAIERFYSDSMKDLPLAQIAEHAYMVKGEKITSWPV